MNGDEKLTFVTEEGVALDHRFRVCDLKNVYELKLDFARKIEDESATRPALRNTCEKCKKELKLRFIMMKTCRHYLCHLCAEFIFNAPQYRNKDEEVECPCKVVMKKYSAVNLERLANGAFNNVVATINSPASFNTNKRFYITIRPTAQDLELLRRDEVAEEDRRMEIFREKTEDIIHEYEQALIGNPQIKRL